MRHSLILWLCCIGSLAASASDSGTISGVVRDAEGKPLAGAAIIIVGHRVPPFSKQTTSSAAGEYRFTDLVAGDYTIRAEADGYAANASPYVHIPLALDAASIDIALTRTASVPASAASVARPQPSLQLQASGLHGLIDPGGYSASTTANAASGLVRGMADLKRSDVSPGTAEAKDWPCSLEPELRKAVEEHSDDAEADLRLGEFYVAHNQPALAIPLLKRTLQVDSSDLRATRALGIAWLESGDFEQAHNLFVSLAERHDEADVHQLLAKADEGSGMFRQAAQEYRISDREEPSEQSVLGVGYELILAGSPAEAVTVFQAGEQKYPQSISLRIGAGTAQFLGSQFAQAIESFLGATDVNPSDSRPYPFLSDASGVSNDQSERVRNSFRRFVDRMPNNAAANYYYALYLSRNSTEGNRGDIEALLKRAVEAEPGLAKAHLLLADTYTSGGNYSEAIPEYETVVGLAPGLNDAHYRLALAYKRAGRAEDSAREMKVFQQASSGRSSGPESDKINIALFISVMDASAQALNAERQCTQSSH
jgi:tetratricopeptide (TPR) repeat protein